VCRCCNAVTHRAAPTPGSPALPAGKLGSARGAARGRLAWRLRLRALIGADDQLAIADLALGAAAAGKQVEARARQVDVLATIPGKRDLAPALEREEVPQLVGRIGRHVHPHRAERDLAAHARLGAHGRRFTLGPYP